MSAEKILSPLPVCESCWINENSKWEPESMDQEGNVLMKLVNIKVPDKRNTGEPDTCSRCGGVTVAGIYEMSDPSVLFFSDEGLVRRPGMVVEDDQDLWESDE